MKKNYNQGKTRTRFLVLMLLFCGFFANTISAQDTYTWNGGADGDWNVAANWTKVNGTITGAGTYPGETAYGSTDIVAIGKNGICTLTASVAIKSLALSTTATGDQGKLKINAGVTLTVNNNPGGAAVILYGGRIDNAGSLVLTSAAANAGILLRKPLDQNPALTPGYFESAGAALTINCSTSGAAVVFNNEPTSTSTIPIVQLNQPTLNLVTGYVVNTGSTGVIGGKGIIQGTGVTRGSAGAYIDNGFLINVIGYDASIEIGAGTVFTTYSKLGSNLVNISPAASTGKGTLTNKGSIIIKSTIFNPFRLQPSATGAAAQIAVLENSGAASLIDVECGVLVAGNSYAFNASVASVTCTINNEGTMNLRTTGSFGTNGPVNITTVLTTWTNSATGTVNLYSSKAANPMGGTINNNGLFTTDQVFTGAFIFNNNATGTLTINPLQAGATGSATLFPAAATITNAGTFNSVSGVSGTSTPNEIYANTAGTSWLSGNVIPGGSGAKGILRMRDGARNYGTTLFKMSISGSATAGTDYDKIEFVAAGARDMTNAKLEVAIDYVPSSSVNIDIMTGSVITGNFGGGITLTGLTTGWAESIVSGNIVRLSYTSGAPAITDYYYNGGSGGTLSDVNNWWSAADGTGTHPADLLASGTSYHIENSSATTAAAWVLGSGSKIVVGKAANAGVTFTVGHAITIGSIDITAASSGANSVIVNAGNPIFGTLDANSEVHYVVAGNLSTGTSTITYGKLFIESPSNAYVALAGYSRIQTLLTVNAGSTLSSSNNIYFQMFFNAGAKAVINGGLKSNKNSGMFTFSGAATVQPTLANNFVFADNNTDTITFGPAGSVEYNNQNNAAVQYVSTLPAGVSYANLIISEATGQATASVKTVSGPISITGKLTVNNLSGGTFNTLDVVTLKSSGAGTAVVSKVEGTITGNVIVERFIPIGHRAYRLLSSPTTGGTLNSNWQEGQTIGNTNPGFGTHLTGAGGVTNGFDATASNASSIYSYNGAYAALTSTSGALTAADAYLVFVRGSRLGTNITAAATNDATTLRTTGTLKTGNHSATGLNATADGFSLVGNPYQAQVDMNAVLTSGSTNLVTGSYITVDPNFGTKGSYVSVDVTTGLNNLPGSTANQYLQPGQACFVKTTTGTPTLQFIEDNKSELVAQTSVFKTKQLANILRLSLYDTANTAKALDGILLTFDASQSNDVNNNDCSKLTNFDESMSTANNGKLLSIEKRALPTSTDEIPLNFANYKKASYTLKVQGSSLSETPYLVDAFTNTTTEVPVDGTLDYAFTVDATNASSAADRFKLIYAKTLGTTNNAVSGFALYPNPSKSNSFNVVVPQSASKASLSVSNLLGQKVYSQKELQSGSNAITVSSVKTAGVYLVSLTLEGKTSTTKWIVE